MTELRDISTPTCISICSSGKFVLIKDLAGKSHIFSKDDKESIGSKIVELSEDKYLPFVEVGKLSVSDEESTASSLDDLDITDLDPDNLKKILIQQALGAFKNFTNYPRGKSVPPRRK